MEGELGNSKASRISFVYDRRTGDVVHIHQFIPVEPGGSCSDDEMEKTALSLAPVDLDREQLDVLHRSYELNLNPEFLYRVDTTTRQLIEEAVPRERISGQRNQGLRPNP